MHSVNENIQSSTTSLGFRGLEYWGLEFSGLGFRS